MTPNREELLFQLALTKPEGERKDWLARECGNDAALRARLEALLAAQDQPAAEMEEPGIPPDDAPTESSVTLLDESALAEALVERDPANGGTQQLLVMAIAKQADGRMWIGRGL